MSTRPLSFRLLLAAAGAGAGLVIWALAGIGLTELGATARFDPMGVSKEPPPAGAFAVAMEWAFPVFALAGAWVLPRLSDWLLVNPRSPDA